MAYGGFYRKMILKSSGCWFDSLPRHVFLLRDGQSGCANLILTSISRMGSGGRLLGAQLHSGPHHHHHHHVSDETIMPASYFRGMHSSGDMKENDSFLSSAAPGGLLPQSSAGAGLKLFAPPSSSSRYVGIHDTTLFAALTGNKNSVDNEELQTRELVASVDNSFGKRTAVMPDKTPEFSTPSAEFSFVNKDKLAKGAKFISSYTPAGESSQGHGIRCRLSGLGSVLSISPHDCCSMNDIPTLPSPPVQRPLLPVSTAGSQMFNRSGSFLRNLFSPSFEFSEEVVGDENRSGSVVRRDGEWSSSGGDLEQDASSRAGDLTCGAAATRCPGRRVEAWQTEERNELMRSLQSMRADIRSLKVCGTPSSKIILPSIQNVDHGH
jgi:hypothetical protein